MEESLRMKEIRSKHSPCTLHIANEKNGEDMQPIRKVKVLSGKERFNMDRRSIPNPKSSNVFIKKTKLHYEVWKSRVRRNYSEI